jgi:hypothetical protein
MNQWVEPDMCVVASMADAEFEAAGVQDGDLPGKFNS